MKILKIIFVAAMLFSWGASEMIAQESSSSSIIRRRSDRDKKEKTNAPGITDRMKSFYEFDPVSEADLTWMRVIYRSLDLTKDENMALYYPEEPTENQENLFRIIMRLLANNQIAAYEYLDGREIFTDQYKIKVKDMLDRFHILYTDAKGSSEKNPKFVIEESDVPANEVLSYFVLERWEFDRVSNRMNRRVEAICPVLHRSGDFGGEAVKYPMFWIKFDALRPSLSQQYIFTDDDNNLPKYNYDDFFNLAMYKGEIYKTRNLKNRSMMQMFPDPDDLKRAQDSIQNRLENYDKHLWVPSREELAAMAEAREAAEAAADSTEIASRDGKEEQVTKSTRSTRSSRGDKATKDKKQKKDKKKKQPKVKHAKVKTSNSGANHSVRRRK